VKTNRPHPGWWRRAEDSANPRAAGLAALVMPAMAILPFLGGLTVAIATLRADARPGGGGRPAGGMARPAGGMARPAGGGMARPAGGMARPSGGMARPSMPMNRPQMPGPQARPMPQMQQRPAARPQMPGGLARPGMQAPSGLNRPSLGGFTRPNLPTAGMTRPAPGMGMSGTGVRPGGSAPRPGLGSIRPPTPMTKPAPSPGLGRPPLANRPTTLPGQIGGSLGNAGLAGRPTTRPSFPSPGIPGRPGTGDGRPGLGTVQRPTTLPGTLAPGISTKPGISTNRPGTGGGNRPGIGGNRPGIGDGNNFWNSGTIGSGNIGIGHLGNNTFNNVNVGGGWGLPGYGYGHGYGYGGWANHWNAGYVNPHYGGWYNGCWGGNWGAGGGWWAPFAVGAATWGLASTLGSWGWGYGGGGYVNPYYSAAPAAVVASSPYDYSQPVVVNNYVTNDGDLTDASTVQGGSAVTESASEASPSDAVFDAALESFRQGEYTQALAACDKAVALAPSDSVIHEVRALSLFALGRYPEAAATLNAVLAVAPGMDWTTMSGLYGSVDGYTEQLRKLEAFCQVHGDDAAAHFVLAYHYLVGGHADLAADALRVVVAAQPSDVVAKRLLEAIAPPAPDNQASPPAAKPMQAPAEATAGPETDLVGTWKAASGKDSVQLAITADSQFTWQAVPAGGKPVEIVGTIETARDAMALVSAAAGTISGSVASKGADAFEFTLAGAPPQAEPLVFQRQKP